MVEGEVSALREAIQFLDEIGIYDVVLPFILVFTMVFAILEKTRVFGTEVIDGVAYTKKNINAMTAFVVAFLVIISSKLVSVINQSIGQIVIVLIALVSFLMLIGIFFSEKKEVILEGGWRTFFMVIIFIGIVLIFVYNLGWFDALGEWNVDINASVIGGIVLVVIIIIAIAAVVHEPKHQTGYSAPSHLDVEKSK